jgi:hypothetical protein
MWFRSNQFLVQDVNNLLYVVSTDNWKTVEVLDNRLAALEKFALLYV